MSYIHGIEHNWQTKKNCALNKSGDYDLNLHWTETAPPPHSQLYIHRPLLAVQQMVLGRTTRVYVTMQSS